MATETGISWTRSTFNPWLGCTKISPGCDACYASVSMPARTRGVVWGAGQARKRTSISNWNLPLRWNKEAPHSDFAGRKGFWPVFCSSLADVFDNEVDQQWRDDLWKLITATPNLTWLLLTKRIGNVMEMVWPGWARLGFPDNVWIGSTMVNQDEVDRDLPKLLTVPARRRFVSYEPALSRVEFGTHNLHQNGLHWIIVGGESKQRSCPQPRVFNINWARNVIEQCNGTATAVFVKQLGSHTGEWGRHGEDVTGFKLLRYLDSHASDPEEWPQDLRRQEFPA